MRNYRFSSERTVFRPSRSGVINTEITFFRTNRQPSSFISNDERFSIGRPRWQDEGDDTSSTRNPPQTQSLSQYELTGIPEPDFSHAPWRPDLTVTAEDEYDYYLRQYDEANNDYINEDYDTFITHTPPPPPRHFRGRLSSTSRHNSSRRDTNRFSYTSNIRGIVNARTLRPSYPSISPSYSSTSNSATRRSGTIRVTVSTTAPKKKEEKPKPKVTLSHRKIEQKDVDEEQSCSICLEPFKKDEKVAVLKCKHFFHEDCIKPWIQDHFTCPICRSDITDDKKDQKKKK